MKHFLLFILAVSFISASDAQQKPPAPHVKLQNIIDLFRNDSLEDAKILLQKNENELIAFVRESNDAESHTQLGRAYFYAEQDQKAITAFEAALKRDPSLSTPHFFIGLIKHYANDLEHAEKSFLAAIAADSSDKIYFIELGRVLERKNDPNAASAAYKKALALDEADFDANFNLATIYSRNDDLAKAEKHLLAAAAQKPTDIDTRYNLGQLYQSTKRHRLAIEQFQAVIELNPNEWRAIAKLVQENEAIADISSRDAAISLIYEAWQSNVDKELGDQGFYIRDQIEFEGGRIYVLEYFELNGERARKFVFHLRDKENEETAFTVSLGSYERTIKIARSIGDIKADERFYHLDGYAPNGSHYTYGFFEKVPPYDTLKEMALKAFAGEAKTVSSTIVRD